MSDTIHQYNAQKHIALRNTASESPQGSEYDEDGIIPEPKELTTSFRVSDSTLAMMDEAVSNLKEGTASDPVDLSEFG